jgi:hypothetical protein
MLFNLHRRCGLECRDLGGARLLEKSRRHHAGEVVNMCRSLVWHLWCAVVLRCDHRWASLGLRQ